MFCYTARLLSHDVLYQASYMVTIGCTTIGLMVRDPFNLSVTNTRPLSISRFDSPHSVNAICWLTGQVFFGCGYAYDATDKNTRTLQGALDGDDMESRNKLRKMSISQLRYLLLAGFLQRL